MNQKLCLFCNKEYRDSAPIRFAPWVHCHHDEPEPEKREKCWCEYTQKITQVMAWDGNSFTFSMIFCPVCGRKLP